MINLVFFGKSYTVCKHYGQNFLIILFEGFLSLFAESGTSFIKNNGIKVEKVQIEHNTMRFEKSTLSVIISLSIPNIDVKMDPKELLIISEKLEIEISDAYTVASTPFGVIRAAKTNIGKNAILDKAAISTSSPIAKNLSGIPNSKLYLDINSN